MDETERLTADILEARWPGAVGRESDLGITTRVAAIIAEHLVAQGWHIDDGWPRPGID